MTQNEKQTPDLRKVIEALERNLQDLAHSHPRELHDLTKQALIELQACMDRQAVRESENAKLQEYVEIHIKHITRLYKEKFKTLEKVAKALGFKPYGKDQIKWAMSQEDADSLNPGESIYKFVEEQLLRL